MEWILAMQNKINQFIFTPISLQYSLWTPASRWILTALIATADGLNEISLFSSTFSVNLSGTDIHQIVRHYFFNPKCSMLPYYSGRHLCVNEVEGMPSLG